MKQCPKCKAALDDNARFCLHCMTSLDEKEPIPPPATQVRRWPLVLLCVLLVGVLLLFAVFGFFSSQKKTNDASKKSADRRSPAAPQSATTPAIDDPSAVTQTIEGVTFTFRPATKKDHPGAISLEISNYYVLIAVSGTPTDGVYRVPSFVNNDTSALVTVVADGAFAGTQARVIDLGYNVRYVWGNAFGGYPLTDLYFHTDVYIDRAAFSGCTEQLTIHSLLLSNNTEGTLWSELAADYGFGWQSLDIVVPPNADDGIETF